MIKRCFWANKKNPHYLDYHDNEWGKPCYEDQHLFEMLILEGAQAGLSWETVLNKRENYRVAFDQFDPQKVALYDENKKEELRQNEGIIRNRLKIKSAVQNAHVFLQIQKDSGSFSEYLWNFVNHQPILNHWKTAKDLPVTTDISDALSKDLKKKGMNFVGSTIMYAYMQAVGMVDDHLVECDYHHTKKLKNK